MNLCHNRSFHEITGLEFTKSILSKENPIKLVPNDIDKEDYKRKYMDNPIFVEMGHEFNKSMVEVARIPFSIGYYKDVNLHSILKKHIQRGVIDMLIKKSGSLETIIPIELKSLTNILQPMINFEAAFNPEFIEWNLWLLVDLESVFLGETQRNSGAHCDGFQGLKHQKEPITSIYVWTNRLSTEFQRKGFKLPDDFDETVDNVSILMQRDWEKEKVITFPENTIIKMDGVTVHRGAAAPDEIRDRVFVRVCATPGNVLFDRWGNTPNPCFNNYFKWRIVPDPSSMLKNTTDFSTPEQFKNMWDVACLGHPSFSIYKMGKKSHQYQLMMELMNYGMSFIKKVVKMYQDEDNIIEKLRGRILEYYFIGL